MQCKYLPYKKFCGIIINIINPKEVYLMEKTTISFDKIGIVAEILERMNPGIKLSPRGKKTIILSSERKGAIVFKAPKNWEVEIRSYGFFLIGGFEESFAYRIKIKA